MAKDAALLGDSRDRAGDFNRKSNAMLSAFLARALDSAGSDRGAAMKAKDAHAHLSKYQETALACLYEQRSEEEVRAAVEAFATECEVLDRAIPEGAGGPSGRVARTGEAGPGEPAQSAEISESDSGGTDTPNTSDLAAFGAKIRAFNALDDEEKALRKMAALKKVEKQALADHILKFMQKHGLDDVSTRCGTLRCVHRKSRCSLTRAAMAERIRSFFGDDSASAEALRGNLFEGGEEREVVSLRRILPKPAAKQ
jgi:hypothetical protein